MAAYEFLAVPPGPLEPRQVGGPVVVGVIPGQPKAVLQHAGDLAQSLGVDLVCAYVDITTYLVEEEADGTVGAMSIDPDGVDDDAESISATLQERISVMLSRYHLTWNFTTLAGEPARALGRFAEKVQASVIVVGSREHGIGARLEGFLTGSLSVNLAHHQSRPVIVVPLHPRQSGNND